MTEKEKATVGWNPEPHACSASLCPRGMSPLDFKHPVTELDLHLLYLVLYQFPYASPLGAVIDAPRGFRVPSCETGMALASAVELSAIGL